MDPFKPSLLERVFTKDPTKLFIQDGGQAVTPTPSLPSTLAENSASTSAATSASPSAATMQEGGVAMPKTPYTRPVFRHLFIFFLAILIASKLLNTPAIRDFIFKESSPDLDLNNPSPNFKARYKAFSLYTLLYVTFVILMYLLLLGISYMFTALYLGITSDPSSGPVGKLINESFMAKYWKFPDGATMLPYFYALGIVTFGMLAFYLLYFAAVKDYFYRIGFIDYINVNETPDIEETSPQLKYTHAYGAMMYGMMVFLVGLAFFHMYTQDSISIGSFVMVVLLLFIYGIMSLMLLGYDMKKKNKGMFIVAIIFLVISILAANVL